MSFKIISGYTKKTPYEQEIQYLIDSLQKNNISNYEIISYDSLGSWSRNCQYKANIIYNQLIKYNVPIVWLDADAILYDYPKLFENINEDIAFCDYYGGVASGTLYIKPTTKMINLCQEWIELNAKDTNIWDQKNLTILLKKYSIPYCNLPVSYCKIDFAKCLDKIIIGQNQASRRFKKIIDHNPIITTKINMKSIEYASHLKLLTKYLMFLEDNSTIVETGCGFFSSPVISAIAEHKNFKYYIYYSNETYKKEIEKFINNATFIYVNDWKKWNPEIDASLYFHDNEELIVDRYKQINKILPKTKYLILHDYSTYFQRNCNMKLYQLIEEFTDISPSTGVIRGLI